MVPSQQQVMGNSRSESPAEGEEQGFYIRRWGGLKRVQRELEYTIRKCKGSYRRKPEQHQEQNNNREVWRDLKQMSTTQGGGWSPSLW